MTKFTLERIDRPIYNIVGDGSMSSIHLGEGRFIPILMIDAEKRSEVDDLIQVHQGLTGDATLRWSRSFSILRPTVIRLEVTFEKPMNISFAISFNISAQFSLLEGVIQSRAIYLQRGTPGDKVSDTLANMILIEIPELGFDQYWHNLLIKLIKDKLDKRGKSKREINTIVQEQIKTLRMLWHYRASKSNADNFDL